MPFAYYARLTRAQQAVYRKSDGITEVRLAHPAELHPLVGALDTALRSEDRTDTQRATDRLVRGPAEALPVPTLHGVPAAAELDPGPRGRDGHVHAQAAHQFHRAGVHAAHSASSGCTNTSAFGAMASSA